MKTGIIVSRYDNRIIEWPMDKLADVIGQLRAERKSIANDTNPDARTNADRQHEAFNAICEHEVALIELFQSITKELVAGRGDKTGIPALLNTALHTREFLTKAILLLQDIAELHQKDKTKTSN